MKLRSRRRGALRRDGRRDPGRDRGAPPGGAIGIVLEVSDDPKSTRPPRIKVVRDPSGRPVAGPIAEYPIAESIDAAEMAIEITHHLCGAPA